MAALILGIGIFIYQGLQEFKSQALDLHMPVSTWVAKFPFADSTSYLQVGQNFAHGHGINGCAEPTCTSGVYTPFVYWGPGAAWVLGMVMKISHQDTMFQFFVFLILSQIVVACLAGSMMRLLTQNQWIIGITVFLSALGIHMQRYVFGVGLTSSEVTGLIPFSIFFYLLLRLWIRLWGSSDSAHQKEILCLAGLAGITIGLVSLIRDSNFQFAKFLLVGIPLLALIRDRRKFVLSLGVGMLLVGLAASVRLPILKWNKKRIGVAVMATSSNIWHESVWLQHDAADWYIDTGIGMAQYLDPQAAIDVKKAYENGTGGNFYSFRRCLGVLLSNPLRVIKFKAVRLPILLGTSHWPESKLAPFVVWCFCFYLMLAIYLLRAAMAKYWPLDVTYFYMLFLACSSLFIHFEFRYTYPIWITLYLVPGLIYLQWLGLSETSPGTMRAVPQTQRV